MMTLVATVAGLLGIWAAIRLLKAGVTGDKGAIAVAEGNSKGVDGFTAILAGGALILVAILIYLQILAAVGQGSQADNPYIFNWIGLRAEEIFGDGLPQIK
jgi:hypothetical protein